MADQVASRMTVLPGMEVYGEDDAFIGLIEQVLEDGFLMHDQKRPFAIVARIERSRIYLQGKGTSYHPQARSEIGIRNRKDEPRGCACLGLSISEARRFGKRAARMLAAHRDSGAFGRCGTHPEMAHFTSAVVSRVPLATAGHTEGPA